MRLFVAFFKVLGELALGVGALWLYVSGSYKAHWIPDHLRDVETALAVTLAGGALWAGAHLSLRLIDRRPQLTTPEGERLTMKSEQDWDDPAFRRRVVDFTNARAAEDMAAQKKTVGSHIGRAQERICLRPVWPQRETSSWVGGLPHLPAGMHWPAFDGRPATFLAQISLDDLPDTLWQGLGPRTGSLAFFNDPNQSDRIAVRHVMGRTDPRPQPGGVRQNWHATMEPAALEGAIGSAAHIPPRWFLERVDEPALGAVEDMAADDPGFWDSEKGCYIWEPSWPMARGPILDAISASDDLRNGVDWPSFLGLFALWRSILSDRAKSLTEMQRIAPHDTATAERNEAEELAKLTAEAETDPDARETLKKRRVEIDLLSKRRAKNAARYATESRLIADMLPHLTTLESELRQMARTTPLTPELGKEWRALIAAFDNKLTEAGCGSLSHLLQGAAPQALETYARAMYTSDPDNLPRVLFDHFAPLWQLQCRETLIFMGLNHPATQGRHPDARLIDLPPNPLAGVTFGDDSRFYVDLPAASLAENRFLDATSRDTHGLY